MYSLFRSLLFFFDAESVHHAVMNVLKLSCSSKIIRSLIAAWFRVPGQNEVTLWNLRFRNPVGLAAGFDKNAQYLRELDVLGFGFVEIGTVTPKPQAGNERPRLFRLPADRALINRMGFNNEGMTVVAKRLKAWRATSGKNNRGIRLIIGGNIGKNKSTPNEEAWKDYESCFRVLFDYVDYFVVNVSSPNTPGLRELQEKESLRKILTHLKAINQQQPQPKPLLLKIAPDLSTAQLDDIIELSLELKLDGWVATNTTISRAGLHTPAAQVEQMGAGGLSGKPLALRSTEVIRYLHEKSSGSIAIIGSGGVFTASDVQEKMNAGARLVQVWTGFIYEGPSVVKKISKHLSPQSVND